MHAQLAACTCIEHVREHQVEAGSWGLVAPLQQGCILGHHGDPVAQTVHGGCLRQQDAGDVCSKCPSGAPWCWLPHQAARLKHDIISACRCSLILTPCTANGVPLVSPDPPPSWAALGDTTPVTLPMSGLSSKPQICFHRHYTYSHARTPPRCQLTAPKPYALKPILSTLNPALHPLQRVEQPGKRPPPHHQS